MTVRWCAVHEVRRCTICLPPPTARALLEIQLRQIRANHPEMYARVAAEVAYTRATRAPESPTSTALGRRPGAVREVFVEKLRRRAQRLDHEVSSERLVTVDEIRGGEVGLEPHTANRTRREWS